MLGPSLRRYADQVLREYVPAARALAYRDGEPAGFAAAEFRITGRIQDFDSKLTQLVAVAEDRRFFRHFGLDLRGIARAARNNLMARAIVEGASTLDQQLLKNTVLRDQGRLTRKVLELVLAPAIDALLGKQQVLEHYLNRVYVGNGLYGLRTASLIFLGHDVDSLTWAEAAFLAGLPAAPERYAAYRSGTLARERRNHVLSQAAHLGVLSRQDAQIAANEPLPQPRFMKPAYRDFVRRLATSFPPSVSDPIVTTLDRGLQARAARLARKAATHTEFCAVTSVDVTTGEVLAAATAWRHADRGHDVALSPGLSPGSAVKPFTLAVALASGWSSEDRLPSGPVELRSEGVTWRVENWQGRSYGAPTLSEAMTLSDNTVYARLVAGIGHDRVARMMAECGLPALPSPGPTVTLGVLARPIAPVDLAASYSALAEPGLVVAPVLRLGERRTRPSPFSAHDTAEVRNVLHAYVHRYIPASGVDAWGKTGTPDDGRVGWFVGVRRRVATAIAIGSTGATGPAKAYEAALVWERLQQEMTSMKKIKR